HYSLLDSVIKVEEGVKHCLANGISSLAITDHGSMGGIVNFSDICEKNKLPFIVGCEAYISVGEHNSKDFLEVDSWGDEGSKRKTNYHLTLLAKNLEGYLNLCRMSYIAHTEGFYYKPRVSFGTLAKHSKGLIALSGCLGGMLASAARDEDPIKATREVAQQHKDIFDEDYYLELQSHNIPAQINLNKHCIALSKELD
ncbi:PHP domain-containing protein, partial [Mangrovimonas sp. AS39]|uniref:PHP domain-containing protein n=1 Tax=Mangrovimonas futianensis TaxID=2895523 RepID=UPI001E47D5DD